MPARSRLLHFSAWPIAAKLTLVLLASSLAPMGVTAALDVVQARTSAEQAQLASLETLAESTAGRLDQLLADTRRVASEVAGEAEVVSLLAIGPDATIPEIRASVQRTLANVVHANDDVTGAFILDAGGKGVVSSDKDDLGRDYSFREYYRQALHGAPYISEILVGTTSRRPGVYFSQGVLDAKGAFLGVAVIKLSGDVITRMVESVRPGSGGAFLVDGWGVVVSHSDTRLLYRSLSPVSPEVERLPEFEQRFTPVGIEHVESLGLDELGRRLAAKATGAASFLAPAPEAGDRQIAGFSHLATKPWTLVVFRPAADLRAPLARATWRSLAHALLVGPVVVLIALFLARTIVQPVRALIAAARAIQRGDFHGGRVESRSEDEIGALAGAFDTMARGLEARERELEIFGRMVSPEVREKLLTGHLELGGETRRAVVLFSDIRGFSTLSETMDPQAVVALLNEYLTAMTAATSTFNGYVNNFIGDAIVVVFGAPIPRPDAERRAVAAALAMRAALAALNEKRAARGEAALETGIGIAAGDVVAGQIGSPERMLYTVIGDVVNVAARLEALTKEYDGKHILVTRSVADVLTTNPELGTLEPLGPIKLKGRAEPVDVFAVIGPSPRA